MKNDMKRFTLYSILALFSITACQDEVDVEKNLNFPPTVLSISPKTSVKVGKGFDVKVVFVDGASSPLASATVTLKDPDGKTIATSNKTLSGIKDSVVIASDVFKSVDLPLGSYTINVSATDSKNNTTTTTNTFKVATQLYPANNEKMFIAGEFNGWGATALELVSDNTWEIKNVDLKGKAWKLKNTEDWSDQDWGDIDCDFKMEVKGKNGDTKCGFSGLVNVRFNDETLSYTVTPAVNFKTSLSGLYLLGSFNNFEGSEPKFLLVGDYTWQIDEFRFKPGMSFRFSESPYFKGKNYGDSGTPNKAKEYSSNFVLANDFKDAYYKVTFNEKTLAYDLIFVRAAYEMYLVGGGTKAGWDPASSLPFLTTGDKQYEIYADITAGGGFKFLPTQSWDGDYGVDPNNAGKILQTGEENVDVAQSGFYRITVNLNDMSYSATKTVWGIIGDATPGGWGSDTNLTYTGNNTWEGDINLGAGKFKFRANGGWDINFGAGDAAGKLQFNAGDIAFSGSGNYHVKLILDSVAGYTYTLTKN
jgi:hypothetical protein